MSAELKSPCERGIFRSRERNLNFAILFEYDATIESSSTSRSMGASEGYGLSGTWMANYTGYGT